MPEAGDRFDRFVVEAPLGRGGMASVYRVRHEVLGSAHALKVLDLPLPAIRNRLVLEGRLQAQAGHPNIVAVTDLIEVEGAPGLIMELVSGPSLDAWLAANRADAATAELLFRGILDGVAHAHRLGLIHRDLKPANVLVATVDGRLVPKVSDFGLAKVFGDGGSSGTRTGFAMGTPGYMAPEQIRNAKDVDARADVFALGCILYEIWTGRPAFAGEDMFAILQDIEAGRYVPPRTLRPDLPVGVERAIEGCLRADRAERIPDCDALRACLGGASLAEVRATAPARPVVLPSVAAPTFPPPRGSEPGPTEPGARGASGGTLAPAGPPASVAGPAEGRGASWLLVVGVAGVALVVGCGGAAAAGWWWASRPAATEAPTGDAAALVEPVPEAAPADPAPAAPPPAEPEVAAPTPGRSSPSVPPVTPLPAPTSPAPTTPAVGAGGRASDPLSAPEPSAACRLVVTGDADAVWLESGGRRFGAGVVPAGTYAVHARFGESSVVVKNRVTLKAGEAVTVACDAAFSNCRVER